MSYKLELIRLAQPIGTFYISSMPAKLLKDITYSKLHDEKNWYAEEVG